MEYMMVDGMWQERDGRARAFSNFMHPDLIVWPPELMGFKNYGVIKIWEMRTDCGCRVQYDSYENGNYGRIYLVKICPRHKEELWKRGYGVDRRVKSRAIHYSRCGCYLLDDDIYQCNYHAAKKGTVLFHRRVDGFYAEIYLQDFLSVEVSIS